MPSDLTTAIQPLTPASQLRAPGARPRRLVVASLVLLAVLAPGEVGLIGRQMIADAYIQVSVFVAATLLLFYSAEQLFKFDIRSVLRESGLFSVPLAAALGAMPGCGGAVVVVAAYSSGHVGFGAVVATLTATMGDAAFLLIAIRPDAALVVLPLSFVVGVLSGWTVNRFFPHIGAIGGKKRHDAPSPVGTTRLRDCAYLALAIPGLGFGLLQLSQLEPTGALAVLPMAVALLGTGVGLFIWSTSQFSTMGSPDDSPVTRMAEETSFISVWVIGAYLLYEYLVAFSGVNLEVAFTMLAPVLPLTGIIIGFIPGCGPQVLVTSLYVSGVVPFAAVVGNAISNDGDALFPAIAVDARAAVLATLISAIPALIVAYGFYFLAPGFMN